MKRSIKIGLGLIIAGVLLLFGTYLTGEVTQYSWGFNSDGGFQSEYFEFDSAKEAEESFKNNNVKGFTLKREEKTIDSIDELQGKFEFYNVIISRSEDSSFYLDYTYPVLENGKEENLTIKEEKNTLSITQNKYSEDLVGKNGKGMYLLLEIKVPDGKTIDIKEEMGVLKISNVDLKKAAIDLNMGKGKITGSRIKEFTNKVGAGECTINNSVIEKLDTQVNMGTFDLTESEIKGSDIKVEMGETNISQSKMFGRNNLKVEMGTIGVQLDQSRKEIGISAKTEMGTILINGEEGDLKEDENKYPTFLDLKTEAGEINLKTN